MRVIAGTFRGRKLLPPATAATRPVTDRVKQSTFDILAPVLAGATVYDCFAGTGSMGLECLSRGAAHVTFFEADRSAGRLLRQNIAALGVADRSHVVTPDLFRWFASPRHGEPADVIFLDPPYRYLRERPDDLRTLATHIADRHLATAPGLVVFRHDAADALPLPPLHELMRREYGSMVVEYLSRSPADIETVPS